MTAAKKKMVCGTLLGKGKAKGRCLPDEYVEWQPSGNILLSSCGQTKKEAFARWSMRPLLSTPLPIMNLLVFFVCLLLSMKIEEAISHDPNSRSDHTDAEIVVDSVCLRSFPYHRCILIINIEKQNLFGNFFFQKGIYPFHIKLVDVIIFLLFTCLGQIKQMSRSDCPQVFRAPQQTRWNATTWVRTTVLTVCHCCFSLSLVLDRQVFTRVKTRMELNSCFNQDQNPAAFVRDWRSKKISPANKSINQDTAPIVRRKTVITIGCPSELKGSIYQPEDHTVSASEVGETACGRISITVKTLPKTGIRKIPQGPIFNCDLHEDKEEWKDTVPFKSSSVSDPSWIYVPTKPVQPFSSNHQLTAWQEEQPSHDFGATLVSNSFKASNKKSCPTIDVDADQQFGNRKVNSDAVISKLDSPKVCAKPTFNVIMSGESKILHLAEQDAWSIEKDACRVEKSPISSISRSPIGYRDWLKSLDRLEGESFPNQIHSTVDKKMKYQEVKQSTDPVTMASNSSAIIQQVESLSAPRSILKNGQHECDYDIRQEKLDGVQNQQYQNKAVQAKIVHEDKPIKMHNKTPLNWTDERSTSSLVGWTATFNNITDSKFNKMVPTKEVTHHAVPSKNEGFTANHQPTTTRGNTMMILISVFHNSPFISRQGQYYGCHQ